jgi:hypothetical protein
VQWQALVYKCKIVAFDCVRKRIVCRRTVRTRSLVIAKLSAKNSSTARACNGGCGLFYVDASTATRCGAGCRNVRGGEGGGGGEGALKGFHLLATVVSDGKERGVRAGE